MWSAFATGIALLALKDTRRTTLLWCWLPTLLAAPGIIGALSAVGDASTALQRFVVLEATPYHTDPFFGGTTLAWEQVALHTALLAGMLAFNLWMYRRSEGDLTQRFFAMFQIAAAVPFALAFVARAFHVWWYLRLVPLRSFPLMIPLVFFFQAFRYAQEVATGNQRIPWRRRRHVPSDATLVILATLAIAVVPTAPLLAAPRLVARNYDAWTRVDHVANAFDWVRQNTSKDTRCIFPIDRQDSFERAERPHVANWEAIPYDRLPEWQRRMNELVGGAEYFKGSNWHGDLPDLRAAYNRLTTAQIEAMATEYDVTCLVSETEYPFPVLHRDGDVRVYGL
jgi:hypothetical protein